MFEMGGGSVGRVGVCGDGGMCGAEFIFGGRGGLRLVGGFGRWGEVECLGWGLYRVELGNWGLYQGYLLEI